MWFKNDGNNRIVNRNTRNRMSNQLADFQTFLLFVTHLVEVITKGLFADALYHELSNLLFSEKVRFLLTNKLQGRFGTRNRFFWHTCAKAEVLVFPNGVKKVLKAVFNS